MNYYRINCIIKKMSIMIFTVEKACDFLYKFPIGAITNSFCCDYKTAIKRAASIGVDGIQTYAAFGDVRPIDLNVAERKELLSLVKNNGLVFSAMCGDYGLEYWKQEQHHLIIEKMKGVIELARDLETNIITTHLGVIPSESEHERYKILQDICFRLAEYAQSSDVFFAIETGPEPASVLKGFIDSLNSKRIAVNLDPANLVMSLKEDPVEAVYTLKNYIVHTHAKDGIFYSMIPPEYDYGIFPMPEEYKNVVSYEEVPLGEGQVDFKRYLAALEEIGYKGFLTIEREVGDNPSNDIKKAFDYLRNIIESN